MDQVALVEEKKEDGRKLVEQLAQAGFEVTAAAWLKPAEAGQWYLYIASPAVDSEGPVSAYRRVHTAMRRVTPSLWVDPFEVRLLGAADPLTTDLLRLLERYGRGPLAINYGGSQLGGVSIEGAHIYPLPAAISGP